MEMLITVIAGIAMLILVVVIHEGGHAFTARIFGVGVVEFGIGFGKPRIKIFQTKSFPIYFCLILLGGYVRIKARGDKKSYGVEGKFFDDVSLWQKLIILSAGVLMNLAFAVVLRMIIFIIAPEGMQFKFLILPISLAAVPVWYLIPYFAVKFVFITFYQWFVAMILGFIGLFSLVFDIFSSSSTASPVPLVQAGSGMIAMVGLGNAIHKGFLTYLCVVYYISVLLASMNLLPIFPLDGGNAVLETIKEAERKINKNFLSIPFKIIKGVFQCAGFGFVILLLLLMVWSDILTVWKFFN